MPFLSRSQSRLFFAKERAGELPKGTALRWAHETDDIKKLPNKVRRKRMKKTASEIFFEALVKTAFSVTREGHEYDTRRAQIEEKAAAQHLKLMAKHKALPDRGDSAFAGTKRRFRGFMAPESAFYLRHHAYTARKHAQGKNAYNPFGGFTIPSKYERGGTRNRFGKIEVKD